MSRNGYRSVYSLWIAIGLIPFVIWRFYSPSIWPEFFAGTYILTGYLILMLVVDYPGPENRWYWKLIFFSVALHGFLIGTFAAGAIGIVFTGIKPPTGVYFGLVGIALVIESKARVKLTEILAARTRSRPRTHPHPLSAREDL